jgi:peptidoglycan/LPS O-acetylase OafA/YrhL
VFLRRHGLQVGEHAARAALVVKAAAVIWGGVSAVQQRLVRDVAGFRSSTSRQLMVDAAVAPTSLGEALQAKPLVWPGSISYSLYLWHHTLLISGGCWLSGFAHFPLAVAVSIEVAWLSGRFVACPFCWRLSPQPVPALAS